MVIVDRNNSKSTKCIEGLEQKIKAFGAKLKVTEGQKNSTCNNYAGYLYTIYHCSVHVQRLQAAPVVATCSLLDWTLLCPCTGTQ